MGSQSSNIICSCRMCASTLTSNSDLKTYVYPHEISELHCCDVCNKKFSKACFLRQHKTRHTEKLPYKCAQCNKSYTYLSVLKMHMRSHKESKPFVCKISSKELIQSSHLSKHQRQHLVEAKLSNSSREESQSNSKHPQLHPLKSSIHSVHRMENNDSECNKPVGISSFPDDCSIQQQDSNGRDEKVIITLGSNSILDESNGEASNFQYFHNSSVAKPVDSECNKPVGISSFPDDCSIQQQRKSLRNKTHYSSNMDFEIRKMMNSLDLAKSTAVEDRKLENYRKMKVKDEKLDELNKEAYAEEQKRIEYPTYKPEKIYWSMPQIVEVREMAQHEIKKETIDAMTNVEEEVGRLMIVDDTEMKALDSNTFLTESDEIERICSVVSQNEKVFSENMQHYWENTLKQTNSPFDILRPTATLPFNEPDFSDFQALDMCMQYLPEEEQQIDCKKMRHEISAFPACINTMEMDHLEHLTTVCSDIDFILPEICMSQHQVPQNEPF